MATPNSNQAALWQLPPDIKIYEALGAIGDGRVQVHGREGRVFSSTGAKIYDVTYDPDAHAIMANDNGSYWQGYVGYPAISYLLVRGELTCDPRMYRTLKAFNWKQINTRFNNEWAKSISYIREQIKQRQPTIDFAWFDGQTDHVRSQLAATRLKKLGPRVKPPFGS